MNYYNLHCEVPGGLGSETIYDKSQIPWRIVNLHLVFDGWLGGEILKVSSAIIVTNELANKISFAYSGIESYESLYVERSDIFDSLQPDTELPQFKRILIGTNAFIDDFAIVKYGDYYNQLIISERAKNLLNGCNLGNYSIESVSE